MWPNVIDATTLPPRELKNTIRLSLLSSAPDLRKSTKACGVEDSITPSATMTCGQRTPQRPTSRGATRKVIEPDSARAVCGAAKPQTINANPNASLASAPALSLVGGDGLEPPTLSV